MTHSPTDNRERERIWRKGGLHISAWRWPLSRPTDLLIGMLAATWVIVVGVASREGERLAYDDAFISFQYARNLGRGLGLVFNLGERVWGFTSPLQMLILGLLTSLGIDTVRAAFYTGFLWTALAAILLYVIALRLLSPVLALSLAGFFLLDCSQHGCYSLESSLLVAVQLGFLLALLGERPRLANVLGGLACLVRPDSLLLVLPGLLMNREARRWRKLAWFVAIGLAWEGFALAYYGELIPNSYHAKSGLTGFLPFLETAAGLLTNLGAANALDFSESSTVLRALVVLASLAPIIHPEVRQRPFLLYSLVIYPWVLIGAYSIIGTPETHTWEIYSARFLLRVSAVLGLLCVGRAVAIRLRLPTWMCASGVVLAAVYSLGGGVTRTANQVAAYRTVDNSFWGGGRYRTYRKIAGWANRNIPPGSTVAINEVGTFAYFTDLQIIDVGGIVTRGYAPDERMNYERFLLRFRPTFAIIPGDHSELAISPSLSYSRVAYFPAEKFRDFTVLQTAPGARLAFQVPVSP
jgi:hypothetical protein